MSNFLLYLFLLFFNNFLFHSQSLICARCITLKQQCVPYTNTNTLAMIPTYGGVLSAIEKILRKIVKKYREVGKSLWDLVEGQKRIETAMEWKWGLEGEDGKEESRDDMEGSENSPRES